MPQRYSASPQKPSESSIADNGASEGLREKGNINLNGRPVVANSDGSYSTEKSFSVGSDKGEVLLPSIVKGRTLSQSDAVKHYRDTGEHMGVFDTPAHADAYAEKTHNRTLKDSSGKTNYEGEAATHPPVSRSVPKGLR